MVSWYPPMRGGIARYAEQLVASLRAEGDEVAVASPVAFEEVDHVLDLTMPGAGWRLARQARRYDRLVIQFQPEMLGAPGTSRVARARALLRLAAGLRAARSAELCVHEVDYGQGAMAPLMRAVLGPVWRLADLVTVHTERERDDFSAAFGFDRDRIRVVSQGEHLRPVTDASRADARAGLGVPSDAVVLLAIGFLQPNKGFDRAIRAFGALPSGAARLYVVGSIWHEDETSLAHLAELRRLADAAPGVELREGYVGDADFDGWIVASDALVLPYRLGWSSNVMERGLLYDRPVVMSRVGGMAEQGAARPGVTLVDDDAGLAGALSSLVASLGRDRIPASAGGGADRPLTTPRLPEPPAVER